ncbi:MAG: DUF4197 domain-containing protein [Bacteroidota bacterium]
MIIKHLLIVTLFAAVLSLNSHAQNLDQAMKLASQGKTGLTEKDAADAIKESLVKGTGESVALVSKADGYFRNPEIKIPFPESAREIETKLRSMGMGKQVDEAVLSINRAAEDAAKSAEPIFVGAVKKMTVADAVKIVRGKDNAATEYLSNTTTPELKTSFTPVIKTSLDRVNATKYWGELINIYNKIPFVKKQNPDLAAYTTDMAIKGLFTMIAKEEVKIRQNPAARTTELLKKAFGQN